MTTSESAGNHEEGSPRRLHRSALRDEIAHEAAVRLIADVVTVRKTRGTTQGQVADTMGTSQRTVSYLESVHHMPVLDMFISYVNAVGGQVVVEFPDPDNGVPPGGPTPD